MPAQGSLVATALVRAVGAGLVAAVVAQLLHPVRGFQPHPPLLVALATTALLGLALRLRARRPRPRPVPRVVAAPWVPGMAAAVLAAPHAWCLRYWYGWDAGYLRDLALTVSQGRLPDDAQALYLSQYPINLPVLDGLLATMAVARSLGTSFELVVAVLDACAVGILVALVGSLLATHPGGVRAGSTWPGLVAQAVTTALVGLSPWVSLLYSDQMALIFPLLVLWLAVRAGSAGTGRAALTWSGLAGVATGAGTSVKATVLVAGLAAALGIFLGGRPQAGRGGRSSAWTSAGILLAASLCAGTAWALPHAWLHGSGVASAVDARREMPVERWVWVGLTPTTREDGTEVPGVYSRRIDTVLAPLTTDEARQVSRDRVAARVCELGPAGLLRWEVAKVRWNLSDGMFTAYAEGDDADRAASAARAAPWWEQPVRRLAAPGGAGYPVRGALTQASWMATLALAGVGCLTIRRDRVDALTTSLTLSVAGIVAFTALLEARPRYVWIYAAVVVALAGHTWRVRRPG